MEMTVRTISSTYADFVVGTTFDRLPAEAVEQSKKLVLDLVGVSLAGYQSMPFPKMMVDYVLAMGGSPEATVIQGEKKVPAAHAALANASCVHALDMDDGHRFAASHPGADRYSGTAPLLSKENAEKLGKTIMNLDHEPLDALVKWL
jgi:2-methylcitrate dehydratase PrpD